MTVSGRVISLDRGYPLVKTDEEEIRAQHSIDLVKNSDLRSVVGDIVDLEFPPGQDTPLITAIHPRGHTLYRRSLVESRSVGSGKYEEKILATNIDIVFIVSSLSNRHVDLAYLERQLVMAHESGAEVAVVLTKADQAKHLEEDVAAVKASALGCEVIVESAVTGVGVERVRELIVGNRFGVLLGRSGVGKSTLINALVKEPLLQTGAVRAKDRAGRHTTVGRKMIFVDANAAADAAGADGGGEPGSAGLGGAIIDTPGLRSIGLYDAFAGLAATFPDIEKLAEGCRYRDCTHTSEPGCAVLKAAEEGLLPTDRLISYTEIAKEVND
jgi:ribosome biogenesis GTPase